MINIIENKNLLENKKGVSEIISIVSMTLIVIASITVIYIFFINYIEVNLSPEFNCFDLKITPPIRIYKACYNQETEDVEVDLIRLGDFNIDDIKFILTKEGENKLWSCGLSCGTCSVLEKGDSRKYFLSVAGLGKQEKVALSYFNCIFAEQEIVDC